MCAGNKKDFLNHLQHGHWAFAWANFGGDVVGVAISKGCRELSFSDYPQAPPPAAPASFFLRYSALRLSLIASRFL